MNERLPEVPGAAKLDTIGLSLAFASLLAFFAYTEVRMLWFVGASVALAVAGGAFKLAGTRRRQRADRAANETRSGRKAPERSAESAA